MDSLKETDKPAPNPSKHPRIEVDEELMRQMIAGQAPLDSKVIRRIPEPEAEIRTLPRKRHRKRYPEHRLRLLKGQTPIPKRVT